MIRGKRLLAMVGVCFAVAGQPCEGIADDPPCELGKVNWQRDYTAAKAASSENGKPILLLFQEVPGCQTCQDFGNQPLSHPLMVEAIEDLFIPVLVYNNKPEDADLLKSFNEPEWNNPVIRYVDSQGDDLIPRKDRVWQTIPTAQRMVASLEKAGREIPQYLRLLAREGDHSLARATFAMHCYWEGEAKLGKLDGVRSTRSAWVGEKEVVEITYDEKTIDYLTLLDNAKSLECATTVYAHDDKQMEIAKRKVGEAVVAANQDFKTRDAKTSDQKYYLRNSVYRHLPLSNLQAVKINAELFPNVNHQAARAFLSPRQLKLLAAVENRLAKDKDSLNQFVFPDKREALVAYDQKLRDYLQK